MRFNLTTFVFELVNFVVLLALLQRVVYRPLKEGVARRQAELAAREAEAARREAEAAALKADMEARARAIDELRQSALRDAGLAAAEERARILKEARDDASADRARAQRVIDAEHSAAEAAVRELAVEHATRVAAKLLSRLAPAELTRALADALERELSREADAWRAHLEGGGAREVEVTWAQPPSDELARSLDAALERALGAGIAVSRREDPALDAGLVVRFGHRVLDASLAGELDALRARARELLAEPS